MTELSERLLGYIKKVEKETGRRVFVEKTGDLGLSGMASGFVQDPAGILVRLSPELHGRQLEHSIAHEITHGLLRYKKGFPQIIPRRPLSEKEAISISILCSMLEDIVVNKITYAEGFPLFASNYLETVQKEEEDINKGEYFSSTAMDLDVRNRLMVSRYTTAWGFLEYFDMDFSSKEVLDKFVRSFERYYPKESEMTGQIKDIITQNDIFNPDGYNKIIRRCLKLWGLCDLVELRVAE